MATVERLIGKSIKRREDPRFITGRGTYVDDVKIAGLQYVAFKRFEGMSQSVVVVANDGDLVPAEAPN